MEMKDIGKRDGPSNRTIREGGLEEDQDGEEEEGEEEEEEEKEKEEKEEEVEVEEEEEEEEEEEKEDGFVTCREERGGEDRGEGWNI